MSLRVKIRQMVEFVVEIDDRNEWEVEDFNNRLGEGKITIFDGDIDNDSFETLRTEVVDRDHSPNYVFDVNDDEELFLLRADREIVFSHRDHNEVVREWGRLNGKEVSFSKDSEDWYRNIFLDYGDPDECWDLLKNRNNTQEG